MKSPRTGPALEPVSSGRILPTRSLGSRTQSRAAAGPLDSQAGARAAQGSAGHRCCRTGPKSSCLLLPLTSRTELSTPQAGCWGGAGASEGGRLWPHQDNFLMVGLPVDGRQEAILSTREGILSLIKSSTSFVK